RDRNVTGVQTCALPISIHSDLFSEPNDRVVVWYGRAGFLGLDAHIESEGTDNKGNVVTVVIDERQHLTDVSLVEGRTANLAALEIGRASCRERVGMSVG